VLDTLRFRFPLFPLTEAYKLLAQSGIDADDAAKSVKELSGGLKAKLALAILQAEKANVLILDEPTNHLDLPSREALEEALAAFDGTLLFVSHDRRFIESVATQILTIENGTLTRFEGTYSQYLASRKDAPKKPTTEKEPPKQDGSFRSKEERAKEAKRRTRMREIELRLEAIETEEAELNNQLVAFASDYEKVREITKRLEEIHSESDALYDEYGTLI